MQVGISSRPGNLHSHHFCIALAHVCKLHPVQAKAKRSCCPRTTAGSSTYVVNLATGKVIALRWYLFSPVAARANGPRTVPFRSASQVRSGLEKSAVCAPDNPLRTGTAHGPMRRDVPSGLNRYLRCFRTRAAGGKAGSQLNLVPRLHGAGTPQRGVPTLLNTLSSAAAHLSASLHHDLFH